MKRAAVLGTSLFTLAMISFDMAQAQFAAEGSISGMYDDNINNNYLHLSDKISVFSLNTGYSIEAGSWNAQAYYDGILNYFQSVTERTNQFHSGNLLLVHYSGEDDENVLNLGLSAGRGYYRDSYSFYDHSLVTASINFRQFLSDQIISKVGYTFRSASFDELSDFSYSEHAVSGNFSLALPTSTTLILQGDLGAKFYSTDSPLGGTGGMRKSTLSILPNVTQLTGMARIGQSIFEGTGLSLTSRYQWNIQKQTRFLSSSYGIISDDELFDDHYGYEGLHTSLMLTQVLSGSTLLRITGGLQNRLFSSLAAYNLEGNQVANERVDKRSYVSVFVQKDFDIGFRLKAAYDFIWNVSNDKFHDYDNNAITLEFTVPF